MTGSKALTVKFNEIPDSGLDYKYTHQSGELNQVLSDLLGHDPVYQISLHLKNADVMAQLKGRVSGELNQVCSRCAEDFQKPFSKSFTIMYYQSESSIKTLGEGMDELEGSFDLEYLEGNEINLGEAVHEQIALEIPFQPLCSETCKGLCPQCGTNLNITTCHCDRKLDLKRHSPFESLKGLRGE